MRVRTGANDDGGGVVDDMDYDDECVEIRCVCVCVCVYLFELLRNETRAEIVEEVTGGLARLGREFD